MSDKYILKDRVPVPCDDLLEWGRQFEQEERRVARTEQDEVEVSTVFLGLDHSFGGGPPLLFETMVFGGGRDQEMRRYSTWDQAEEGDKAMCDWLFHGGAEPG